MYIFVLDTIHAYTGTLTHFPRQVRPNSVLGSGSSFLPDPKITKVHRKQKNCDFYRHRLWEPNGTLLAWARCGTRCSLACIMRIGITHLCINNAVGKLTAGTSFRKFVISSSRTHGQHVRSKAPYQYHSRTPVRYFCISAWCDRGRHIICNGYRSNS